VVDVCKVLSRLSSN